MRHLILFAKRPRLGRVKTRLVPPLTGPEALGLYRAFLLDQLRFLGCFPETARLELCLDGPSHEFALPPDAPSSLEITRQTAGDLGSRMLAAFRRSHNLGSRATIIVGADCPTLPASRVELAFEALEQQADAVLVPAEDGGYVLIGLPVPRAELFRDVPWGTERVLETTLRRAGHAGCTVRTLAPWYDVDDRDDLRRLTEALARPGGEAKARAPATARAIRALVRIRPGVI